MKRPRTTVQAGRTTASAHASGVGGFPRLEPQLQNTDHQQARRDDDVDDSPTVIGPFRSGGRGSGSDRRMPSSHRSSVTAEPPALADRLDETHVQLGACGRRIRPHPLHRGAEQSQRLPAQASPLVGNDPGGERCRIGRLQFRRRLLAAPALCARS